MKRIADSNKENQVMVEGLNIIFPQVVRQFLRLAFLPLHVDLHSRSERLLIARKVLGHIHVEDAKIMIDSPRDVALGMINLCALTEAF